MDSERPVKKCSEIGSDPTSLHSPVRFELTIIRRTAKALRDPCASTAARGFKFDVRADAFFFFRAGNRHTIATQNRGTLIEFPFCVSGNRSTSLDSRLRARPETPPRLSIGCAAAVVVTFAIACQEVSK